MHDQTTLRAKRMQEATEGMVPKPQERAQLGSSPRVLRPRPANVRRSELIEQFSFGYVHSARHIGRSG